MKERILSSEGSDDDDCLVLRAVIELTAAILAGELNQELETLISTSLFTSHFLGVIPLAAAWAKTASFERLQAMAPLVTFSTVENFIDWIRLHG